MHAAQGMPWVPAQLRVRLLCTQAAALHPGPHQLGAPAAQPAGPAALPPSPALALPGPPGHGAAAQGLPLALAARPDNSSTGTCWSCPNACFCATRAQPAHAQLHGARLSAPCLARLWPDRAGQRLCHAGVFCGLAGGKQHMCRSKAELLLLRGLGVTLRIAGTPARAEASSAGALGSARRQWAVAGHGRAGRQPVPVGRAHRAADGFLAAGRARALRGLVQQPCHVPAGCRSRAQRVPRPCR